MSRAPLAAAAALLSAAVTGCALIGGSSPTPSGPPALGFERLPNVQVEITEETIVGAIGADQVEALFGTVPRQVDPARQAVICVGLGMRPTGGYGIILQSASLVDGELRIRARETLPRPGAPVTQAITYPFDCGTVRRDALPTGELPVRADDTKSDEFITEAVIEVPPPDESP